MTDFGHRLGIEERCGHLWLVSYRILLPRVFLVPCDLLESVSCPLHRGKFLHEHLLWDSTKESEQRDELLGHELEVGEDIGHFVHVRWASLGEIFLPFTALSEEVCGVIL